MKVAVLGAAGGIGQALSLLLKTQLQQAQSCLCTTLPLLCRVSLLI